MSSFLRVREPPRSVLLKVPLSGEVNWPHDTNFLIDGNEPGTNGNNIFDPNDIAFIATSAVSTS